jgi:hypothetical protein
MERMSMRRDPKAPSRNLSLTDCVERMSLLSGKDRLRSAVRFAVTEVFQLGEPGLDRLRRELEAFLGTSATGGGVRVVVTAGRQPWDLVARDLHELAEGARDLLMGAAQGDGTAGATSVAEAVVVDVVRSRSGSRTLRIGGSVQASFRLALAFLLATDVGGKVRRCSECERCFVRVRRQLYCSPT